MRRILIVPATLLLLATGSGLTFASSDDDARTSAPRDQWMTIAQITAKFADEGYDVRQVKEEDGGYELYAIDKDGRRIEAFVDPVTGALLKSENDD